MKLSDILPWVLMLLVLVVFATTNTSPPEARVTVEGSYYSREDIDLMIAGLRAQLNTLIGDMATTLRKAGIPYYDQIIGQRLDWDE